MLKNWRIYIKKLIIVSCVFLFLVSCKQVDKKIAFLNSKNTCVFLDDFSKEKCSDFKYITYDIDEFILNDENNYYFICFKSGSTVSEGLTSTIINQIANKAKSNRILIAFYTFSDLSFLKGTELDYGGGGSDYSIQNNEISYFEYNSRFNYFQYKRRGLPNKPVYEDNILYLAYDYVYSIEETL